MPDRHFDELTGLLFIDQQLDAADHAAVSTHVAECDRCRKIIETLRRESRWLGQALLEEVEAFPPRFLAAPGWAASRIAPWAWTMALGLAGAAIYAAWTAILGPWLDQLDLLGMGGANMLAVMFFSGAFWGGWDSMIDTLQYAMLLSLGIGLLILLRHSWRRWTAAAAIAAGLMLLFGASTPANAAEIRRGPSVRVAEGETVHNDLIAAGNSIRIDGSVDGDVIAFGQDLSVDGHVTGDVIAFSRNVRIVGPVDGNVRCFCGSLAMEGPVGKNATIFSADTQIDPRASLGGGVIAFVGNFVSDGKIARDLLLFARNATLNGTIGGNVSLRGGNLIVGPGARISGGLHVVSDRRPNVATGASLGQPLQFEFRARRTGYRSGFVVVRAILRYGAAFLFGLLLIVALPGLFSVGMRTTRQPGLAIGVGTIVLICGVALAIFSVLVLLAGVGTGVAVTFLYVPILYGAQVFVGTWIGEKLLGKVTVPRAMLGRLALGLLLLHIAEIIPVLGVLVWLAAAIWGTGAVSMALWERLRPEASAAVAASA